LQVQKTFGRRTRAILLHRGALSLVALVAFCLPAAAEQVQVTLNPSDTKIDIAVHDVHGGFHGSFKLKSGAILFDRQTGAASGEIIVDATSGETGNSTRDHKMHNEVLESPRYPEIVFLPKRVIGEVARQGTSNVQVEGIFRIHGADHELTVAMPVEINGDKVSATLNFAVPYDSWGMKNPSVLFLRVSGKADVTISAMGKIAATNTNASNR